MYADCVVLCLVPAALYAAYLKGAASLAPFNHFPSAGIAQFAVCEMGGVETLVGQDTSRLYIDQTLVSPQCASFAIHTDAFLIFTVGGSQHAMFFLDLKRTLAANLLPENRYVKATKVAVGWFVLFSFVRSLFVIRVC